VIHNEARTLTASGRAFMELLEAPRRGNAPGRARA
jgi:hypothetical protein